MSTLEVSQQEGPSGSQREEARERPPLRHRSARSSVAADIAVAVVSLIAALVAWHIAMEWDQPRHTHLGVEGTVPTKTVVLAVALASVALCCWAGKRAR